jgi:signal transduction histidine kinase
MRVTWKLSVALVLGMLAVLAGYGIFRLQLAVSLFRQQTEAGRTPIVRALAVALENVSEREGDARVREIVAAVDASSTDLRLSWSDAPAPLPATDGPRFRWVERDDGVPLLVTTVVLESATPHVLDLEERVVQEPEVRESAQKRIPVTSAVVLALCLVVILVFGVTFVGRPLHALREHALRIGRGERGARTPIDSSDEIGDLARAMNAMSTALDEASERVRREEAARLNVLDQLRHADRLRAVGEIAAGIAHDLGTPMGSASARAQMIASGEVDATRARELAGTIVEEIERMTGSIRLLLDHARRDPPSLASTSLAGLVSEVQRLLAPLGDARGVTITSDCTPDDARANLDAAQMRHVLINVVSNAIDASPSGAEVELRARLDARHVVLTISDRGEGIAPDQLALVFEPFFTTKPRGEGTGLGLSVARTIVEEHGGTLTFHAREGGGSTFEITLPRAPGRIS